MSITTRIRAAVVLGVLTAAMVLLLPATAFGHSEHPAYCNDTSTVDVGGGSAGSPGTDEAGAVESLSSDDEAACPDDELYRGVIKSYAGGIEASGGVAGTTDRDCVGGAGGGGGGASSGGGVLAPDTSTGDMDEDSASAGIGSGLVTDGLSWNAASWGRRSHSGAAASVACETFVLSAGEGVVAPNRIDAGGGGAAPARTSPAAVAGLGAMTLLAGAAAAPRRRRT